MVKIRLRRTGAKKKPTYRVVIADSRSPRDGRFIEIIGHYNPRTEPVTLEIHEDRVLHWLSVGAQPTDIVQKLLKNSGTLDRLARLKEGTDLAELLAEAEASRAKHVTSAKTSVKKAKKEVETETPGEEVIEEIETETPDEEVIEEVETETPDEEVTEGVEVEAQDEGDEAVES